jgi:hypothetical protein
VLVLRAPGSRVGEATNSPVDALALAQASASASDDDNMVAEVVVGTHIRGVADTASPVGHPRSRRHGPRPAIRASVTR